MSATLHQSDVYSMNENERRKKKEDSERPSDINIDGGKEMCEIQGREREDAMRCFPLSPLGQQGTFTFLLSWQAGKTCDKAVTAASASAAAVLNNFHSGKANMAPPSP